MDSQNAVMFLGATALWMCLRIADGKDARTFENPAVKRRVNFLF